MASFIFFDGYVLVAMTQDLMAGAIMHGRQMHAH